jgi:hypothetical protein
MDFNMKHILKNVEDVFKSKDISRLSKQSYQFITLYMGFIAHYDLHGFRNEYADLRDFAKRLQTSEYSNDPDYNLRQADREETDADFRKRYGEEKQKEKAETIREIVKIARKHEKETNEYFGNLQRLEEISIAKGIAEKYGLKLTKMEREVEKSCDTCRKCGTTNCGNDIKELSCYE